MGDNVPFPRIKGKAFEIKKTGGWSWFIEISVGDSEEVLELKNDEKKKVFMTKELAIEDLKKEAQYVADTISRDVYKQKPSAYLDLIKNRVVKKLS